MKSLQLSMLSSSQNMLDVQPMSPYKMLLWSLCYLYWPAPQELENSGELCGIINELKFIKDDSDIRVDFDDIWANFDDIRIDNDDICLEKTFI